MWEESLWPVLSVKSKTGLPWEEAQLPPSPPKSPSTKKSRPRVEYSAARNSYNPKCPNKTNYQNFSSIKGVHAADREVEGSRKELKVRPPYLNFTNAFYSPKRTRRPARTIRHTLANIHNQFDLMGGNYITNSEVVVVVKKPSICDVASPIVKPDYTHFEGPRMSEAKPIIELEREVFTPLEFKQEKRTFQKVSIAENISEAPTQCSDIDEMVSIDEEEDFMQLNIESFHAIIIACSAYKHSEIADCPTVEEDAIQLKSSLACLGYSTALITNKTGTKPTKRSVMRNITYALGNRTDCVGDTAASSGHLLVYIMSRVNVSYASATDVSTHILLQDSTNNDSDSLTVSKLLGFRDRNGKAPIVIVDGYPCRTLCPYSQVKPSRGYCLFSGGDTNLECHMTRRRYSDTGDTGGLLTYHMIKILSLTEISDTRLSTTNVVLSLVKMFNSYGIAVETNAMPFSISFCKLAAVTHLQCLEIKRVNLFYNSVTQDRCWYHSKGWVSDSHLREMGDCAFVALLNSRLSFCRNGLAVEKTGVKRAYPIWRSADPDVITTLDSNDSNDSNVSVKCGFIKREGIFASQLTIDLRGRFATSEKNSSGRSAATSKALSLMRDNTDLGSKLTNIREDCSYDNSSTTNEHLAARQPFCLSSTTLKSICTVRSQDNNSQHVQTPLTLMTNDGKSTLSDSSFKKMPQQISQINLLSNVNITSCLNLVANEHSSPVEPALKSNLKRVRPFRMQETIGAGTIDGFHVSDERKTVRVHVNEKAIPSDEIKPIIARKARFRKPIAKESNEMMSKKKDAFRHKKKTEYPNGYGQRTSIKHLTRRNRFQVWLSLSYSDEIDMNLKMMPNMTLRYGLQNVFGALEIPKITIIRTIGIYIDVDFLSAPISKTIENNICGLKIIDVKQWCELLHLSSHPVMLHFNELQRFDALSDLYSTHQLDVCEIDLAQFRAATLIQKIFRSRRQRLTIEAYSDLINVEETVRMYLLTEFVSNTTEIVNDFVLILQTDLINQEVWSRSNILEWEEEEGLSLLLMRFTGNSKDVVLGREKIKITENIEVLEIRFYHQCLVCYHEVITLIPYRSFRVQAAEIQLRAALEAIEYREKLSIYNTFRPHCILPEMQIRRRSKNVSVVSSNDLRQIATFEPLMPNDSFHDDSFSDFGSPAFFEKTLKYKVARFSEFRRGSSSYRVRGRENTPQ